MAAGRHSSVTDLSFGQHHKPSERITPQAGGIRPDSTKPPEEWMANTRELFEKSKQEFGEKVASIRDDQWGDSTPCSDWDVRALVNHLVYENAWIPPILGGKSIADV